MGNSYAADEEGDEGHIGEEERVYQFLGLAGTQLAKCGTESAPRIVDVLIGTLQRIVNTRDHDQRIRRKYSANQSNGDHTYRAIYRDTQSFDGVNSSSIIGKEIQMFDSMRAPAIGIESYVMRIFKYAKCSPCCFVLAYAYMRRLSGSLVTNYLPHHDDNSASPPADAIISPLNVHRLLITSVLLATKCMEDSHFNNAYFAKIGGISTAEMNGLEIAFLKLIRYRLHVTLMEFERLCSHFAKEAAWQANILVRPPPPPHIQSHASLKACTYDEDRTVALLCTH